VGGEEICDSGRSTCRSSSAAAMAAAAMRAPDPSLLDALPPADLGGGGAGVGPASASAAAPEDDSDASVLRLGPVKLALASADAQLRFKLRQVRAAGGPRKDARRHGGAAVPQPSRGPSHRPARAPWPPPHGPLRPIPPPPLFKHSDSSLAIRSGWVRGTRGVGAHSRASACRPKQRSLPPRPARQHGPVPSHPQASIGAFYSKTDDRIGPTASISYMVGGRGGC
jgi:hypothetical protein